MIKAINITKKYKKFELKPTTIEIKKGEIVALIGANGAGKSTFIKCLCGLIPADGGKIEIDGNVVNQIDEALSLGFLNQEQDVYSEIKIKDITHFVVDLMKERFDKEIYNKYFYDIFKLDEEYKVKELSTGMRVKYFLSLELAKKPDFLVLDEPTSGLDPLVREEVLSILKKLVKESNTTILFSSHITEDIEKIADTVVFIDNGQIIIQGAKSEIKKEFVQITENQFRKLKGDDNSDKFVKIQDYYIVKRNEICIDNFEIKEAMICDILSYIRKKGER